MNKLFHKNYILNFTFCLLVFSAQSVSADDITLKSGKTISNVKTKIKPDSIEIRSEDGKVVNYSKKEVKSLKVRAVVWKPPKVKKTEEEVLAEQQDEKDRVAEASIKGDEFIPRDPDDEINPWGNFALGLIPGYSGMYRTEETWTAATFSVLETFALFYAYDVWQAKQISIGYADLTTGGFIFASTLAPPNTSGNSISAIGIYFETSSIGYKGAISGYQYVSPGPPVTSQKKYGTQRNSSAGILGAILFIDGVMSYFAADSWNEGTFGGEKSEDFIRPTTPWSRTMRSAFLPGWGQVYGGDKLKGYSWMVGGIALLGNVGRAEAAVSAAKKDYQNSGAIFFGPVFSTLLLGSNRTTTSSNDRVGASVLGSYLVAEPAYEKLGSAVKDRNNAWSLYGVYWLINLVDAYFFSGQNLENKEGKITFLPRFQYQPVAWEGNQMRWESLMEFQVIYNF
jgi:hypothetical protein